MTDLAALQRIYQRPKSGVAGGAGPQGALGLSHETLAPPVPVCECTTAWWGSPLWNVWISGHHYKCPLWGETKDPGPYPPCPICAATNPNHHGWDCPWWDDHRSETPF